MDILPGRSFVYETVPVQRRELAGPYFDLVHYPSRGGIDPVAVDPIRAPLTPIIAVRGVGVRIARTALHERECDVYRLVPPVEIHVIDDTVQIRIDECE